MKGRNCPSPCSTTTNSWCHHANNNLSQFSSFKLQPFNDQQIKSIASIDFEWNQKSLHRDVKTKQTCFYSLLITIYLQYEESLSWKWITKKIVFLPKLPCQCYYIINQSSNSKVLLLLPRQFLLKIEFTKLRLLLTDTFSEAEKQKVISFYCSPSIAGLKLRRMMDWWWRTTTTTHKLISSYVTLKLKTTFFLLKIKTWNLNMQIENRKKEKKKKNNNNKLKFQILQIYSLTTFGLRL
jgi:hypothetical protein